MILAHTPYDGSATPFAIGLKPLDMAAWMEPGADLERFLAEKDRLFATHRSAVFTATRDSVPAQQEALALIAAHLLDAHPAIYHRQADRIVVGATDHSVRIDDETPPLERAARLVAEDLVIMQRHDDGWRLTAAALAFPSSWSLAEKFDRPLGEIHRDVPGFGPQTRNEALITRIFDKLQDAQPVQRLNWSIYPDAELHHPENKMVRPETFVPAVGPYDTFIRVERQTLRKLPETGAILFTIRIHVDPLAAIAGHDAAADLARGLHRQIAALTPQQVAYKGLGPTRERLLEELALIADR